MYGIVIERRCNHRVLISGGVGVKPLIVNIIKFAETTKVNRGSYLCWQYFESA